ncbi:glycoside hydrolase family 25 protein [Streptomyces gardneri]|uniref:glycoside hydrolase family 25 protein n=1 Tax=Nocardia TaxID=1817 RepID=UPI00135C01E7|nr:MULTISPECIES: glycoside hydrolase family 25 protein [Nocardia]MBF6164224.1 glycoside hydrolase family 25 protein [Streptomyces gardneri]MBF6203798.1 glycoside hydrolase family 25 protein [Streptomyces gardneri]UAK33836.1 glycoside hydrolase family 25 protein [Nocardia asteroides]
MDTWRSTLRGTALSLITLSGILTATLPANAAPTGPDVSSWQHTDGRLIDWFAVKRSGHDFAMVKATEGLGYINPYFVPDSLLMRAAGMARGTYHYARPNLPPEPQAAMYAAVALGQNGPLDLPPVLDLEDSGGLGPAALIDWTRRYLSTVQALTGRVPIVYTYPNFWRTAMADTAEFAGYPLWIADYRGNDRPEVPGGWSTWTFWQTTDRGAIPGIAGRVDLNVYSGAQGDFARYANMGGSGAATRPVE